MTLRFATAAATAVFLSSIGATAALAACPAAPGACKTSFVSSFGYTDKDGGEKDSLKFKMTKAQSTLVSEFGDPTGGTVYELCLYANHALVGTLTVPADGDCGDDACWTLKSKGPLFKDKAGASSGVTGIKLVTKDDAVDKTKIGLSGKGDGLADLSLPLAEPVMVQLRNSLGNCWGAIFAGAENLEQDADKGTIKGSVKQDVLPTCSDGVANGWESDLDCGGGCPACAYLETCFDDDDCISGDCEAGICAASCDDTAQNGDETGVDCGGSCTADCAFGAGCNGAGDCTSGICRNGLCSGKLVFVTASAYRGDFGGLGAGDTRCNANASVAGLGGTWTAWLSDDITDAIDRIADHQYLNMLGEVAFASRAAITMSGSSAAVIGYDQHGSALVATDFAWTATNQNGGGIPSNCSNWMSTSGNALVGQPSNRFAWSVDGPPHVVCSDFSRLICFEN